MFKYQNIEFEYLNHDCFKIKWDNKVLYTDPYEISVLEKADYITVSHNHFDHLSLNDIKKVAKPETVIVASKNCEGNIKTVNVKEIKYLRPGESVEYAMLKFTATPAYNINKFRAPGQPFHPKQYEGVGFIIQLGDVRIYHAGDTDNIPEILSYTPIDVALLPVSGTYVMTADEAVEMVKMIKPKVAIPMHYGAIVGNRSNAESFKEKASKYCEVVILK
ncbi:MAG: MBL fold metallo-hydrolase [Nitrososphaeria archaeon]|nr:MBL fold metallo-hydrolase [Nitrososphaeria archaeon]